MAREDVALLIAGVSLVGVIASLLWQVWAAMRVDRARLRVEVADDLTVMPAPDVSRNVVVVSATNHGKRQTYLTSLWLAFGRPKYRLRERIFRQLRPDVTHSLMIHDYTDPELAPLTTSLPRMLDVGEIAQVFYDRQMVTEKLLKSGFETIFCTARASTTRAASRPRPLKAEGPTTDRQP